jgi:hypothetical protein
MTKKNKPVESGDPIWQKGVSSGYDPKSGKYRSHTGPYIKREKALEDMYPNEVYGAVVKGNFAPLSAAAERLENKIAGFDIKSADRDWFADTQSSIRPIPASILARMKLAEYYAGSEGDVFQTIEIPMEIGLRFDPEQDIQCKDRGAEKALREFYSDIEGIDLYKVLYDTWLSVAIYGQAFPLIIIPRIDDSPDGAFDRSRKPAVICLNPKTVWVGRVYSMSKWDAAITEEDVQKWDTNLIEKVIPPMMYVALVMRDNEMLQMGRIPINPEYMYPVRDKALPWERYAYPHLSRAFRSISTRQILEEMIRATIEGYKNQLWIFKVGSDTHPASPEKIKRLTANLNALNNERTGSLIFTHDLMVEQHTPKPLDQLLANEAWMSLTYHMFTQIGINPYFISGIRQRGSSSGGMDVDVQILVERVKFQHKQLQRLERRIRKNWAEWDGASEKVRLSIMSATVGIGKIDLGAAEVIKNRLQPLAQMGFLSNQTVIESSNFNYELELARKKSEQSDAELFAPKATFAQQTVNPQTPETETQTAPQGRPQEGTKNADQDVEVEAAESGPFCL